MKNIIRLQEKNKFKLVHTSTSEVYGDYQDIMYIPEIGEIVEFMSAFIGSCVGFLWYNSYPAQVFMGDTGSLSIGGIIAIAAILIRKELLIPILCFFILRIKLSLAFIFESPKNLA